MISALRTRHDAPCGGARASRAPPAGRATGSAPASLLTPRPSVLSCPPSAAQPCTHRPQRVQQVRPDASPSWWLLGYGPCTRPPHRCLAVSPDSLPGMPVGSNGDSGVSPLSWSLVILLEALRMHPCRRAARLPGNMGPDDDPGIPVPPTSRSSWCTAPNQDAPLPTRARLSPRSDGARVRVRRYRDHRPSLPASGTSRSESSSGLMQFGTCWNDHRRSGTFALDPQKPWTNS